MKTQWGIVLCLLAGCVVQPTAPDPKGETGPTAFVPAPAGLLLRIGVEHLPPESSAPPGTPQTRTGPEVEAMPRLGATRPPRRDVATPERSDTVATRHAWALAAEDLAAIDDPIARETLHFVNDLVAEDQRRVQREVRLPFLDFENQPLEAGPLLNSEVATAVAQEEWLHEHGPSLLQRPLRQLLRRLPFAQAFEVAVQDFRSDHVPLSEPYRMAHGDENHLGRLSMRVRTSDWGDPVELGYVRSGIRIGSSQEFAKVSVDWPLTDTLRLELRGRTDYDSHEYDLRADLVYRHNPRTSLHLSVGDDMDFLSTSSIYSLFDSPMDGSAGLLVYAVHVF